jgi:hypothetical protein
MMQISWTTPAGVVWDLGDPSLGYFAAAGVAGLGAVPVTITSDARDRGGETIRRIQPGPRLVTLPLCIAADTESAFLALWRALATAFTCTRYAGSGLLTITRADGTIREIDAHYQDGYDGDPDLGITSDVMALTLRCPVPFWRDPNAVVVVNSYDTSGSRDFLSPYPAVSSGSTFGVQTIANTGGVEVWPSWTITGPASEVIATSNTTGQSWTLTPSDPSTGHGDLVLGETVTITTDPETVRGPLGENWIGALDWPGAELWPLLPGDNEIEYTVTGSAAGTSITMDYYPLYETS